MSRSLLIQLVGMPIAALIAILFVFGYWIPAVLALIAATVGIVWAARARNNAELDDAIRRSEIGDD
ncbi:putative membrane protein [Microbacterium proteolyticum]|uniref:Putative membrane protein n=1 Tax=Microbacterium proteolyticum TaxID=1572644 RepID=A0A7W5GFZ9_9MICO|nr:putative membrane protein [Microbacterium proteolyticum]